MHTLQHVHTELMTAAQGTAVTLELPQHAPFLQGYVAALQDFKTLMDNTGVWWQPLVPLGVLEDAVALRQSFLQRHEAALNGWAKQGVP
jgi:hypothetical protein